MRNMGIAPYFSYVIGSDSVEHHKPHPEPVLKTLRELGFEPSEALVVGDMPVDMEMAHNAGVRAVAVIYGNASHSELESSHADAVIDNLRDLMSVLDSYCNSNSCTYHWVVTHAEEAHHLNVCWN